jgi:long-chain-fatty-acid---luciferin-component ligase
VSQSLNMTREWSAIEVDAIDALVFDKDPFRADLDAPDFPALAARFFDLHYRNSPIFARAADLKGDVRPDAPLTFPVLPTSIFKSLSVTSVADAAIELWCRSSGTSGFESRIGRDRGTLDRLLGSVQTGIRMLGDWYEDEIEIVHLGPPHEAAGDIWFPYVMSLTELLYPTSSFGRPTGIDLEGARRQILRSLEQGKQVGLIGAPFAIFDLCNLVAEEGGIAAGDRLTVVTAGGWKRRGGDQVPRGPFRALVQETLGLDGAGQVRDAFNQVELNTVIFECEHHAKHIPPWVLACARSPYDLAPLAPGETGLLSYLDLSAHSYPCSIIADDVGTVRPTACACGRTGSILDIERRVERGFQRGCAQALETRAAGAAA